jgi:hypothetical protein
MHADDSQVLTCLVQRALEFNAHAGVQEVYLNIGLASSDGTSKRKESNWNKTSPSTRATARA